MPNVQILDPNTAARLDARGESIGSSGALFFGEDLSHELADTFRTMRPDLTAEKAIHFDGSVPYGARAVKYRMLDANGKAQWIEAKTNQLSTVAIGGTRPEVGYSAFGVRIEWDDEDMEAMQVARANGARIPDLYGELDAAARRAILEFANGVAWYGSASRNFNGLLTAPIERTPALVKIAEGSAATGEAIAKKVLGLFNAVRNNTAGKLDVNTCIWPLSAHSYVETTPFNSDGSDLTILEYIKSKRRDVTHEWAVELEAESVAANLTSAAADAIGAGILACHRDRTVGRIAVSPVRHFEITKLGGGMAYEQNVVAKVSDLILAHPNAYAMLTRVNTGV